MSPEMTLYLIYILSGLHDVSIIFLCFAIITIIVLAVGVFTEEDGDCLISIKKWLKILILASIFPIIFGVIIPDEKNLYAMAATHYLNKTELPAKVVDVLNKKLGELMEDKS